MDYEPTMSYSPVCQQSFLIRDKTYACPSCDLIMFGNPDHHCGFNQLPEEISNADYGNIFLPMISNKNMFCAPCLNGIGITKQSVDRHVNSNKHKQNVLINQEGIQTTIEQSNAVKPVFCWAPSVKNSIECILCERYFIMNNSF